MKTAGLQGWLGLTRLRPQAANSASSSSGLLPAGLVLAALVEVLGLAVNFGCILVVLVAAPGRQGPTWAASTAEMLEEIARLEGLAMAKLMDSHPSLSKCQDMSLTRRILVVGAEFDDHTHLWSATAQLRDLV